MAEEADTNTASEPSALEYLWDHYEDITSLVSEYSYLIGDGLGFIIVGVLCVYILHRFSTRFLRTHVKNGRFLSVTFGALYALVMVLAAILAFEEIGVDVDAIGPGAILAVIFLAVLMYFIIPFLPRLPFIPGHMIETLGVMGTVDSISTFHTTIRKFDGTIAFIPNAVVLSSKILNYSYKPNRRIEMTLFVKVDSDLDIAKAGMLEVASSEQRVLVDPAPAVFTMQADAVGVEIVLYCWVANADFLGARSDLWDQLLMLIKQESRLALALPAQEVQVRDK